MVHVNLIQVVLGNLLQPKLISEVNICFDVDLVLYRATLKLTYKCKPPTGLGCMFAA